MRTILFKTLRSTSIIEFEETCSTENKIEVL